MTSARPILRFLAASVTLVVGLTLTLHVFIVSAYGASGGEAVAASIFGAATVLVLVAMWALGRPASLLARTGICLALAASYVAVFVLVV